jgi:thioredoxin reductase (NADPH)
VHRRDTLRACTILQERAMENPRIAFRLNTTVAAILGDQRSGVTGVRLKDVESGVEEDFACHGLFIGIGHTPNTALFKGQLELDDNGYIVTRNGTETSVAGVFAAGDVQDPTIAKRSPPGTGCMAAIQAERYLEACEEQGVCPT